VSRGLYYIDNNLTDEESKQGFYKIAIRKRGRHGWTFRFQNLDAHCDETLRALNARKKAA
jgi:hypothetical protein